MAGYFIDTSIAVDSAGFPHIAYSHDPRKGLGHVRYSYKDAGGWHCGNLPDTGFENTNYQGAGVSLALDAEDHPHITYYQNYQNSQYPEVSRVGLWLAERTDTGWITECVVADPTKGKLSSLAVDASGSPYIAFYDEIAQSLRYAWKGAMGWQFQDIADSIATGTPDGQGFSLAMDATGGAHVSYPQPGSTLPRNLYYAHLTGVPDADPPAPNPMTWASVPAASEGGVAQMTATTAVDPRGVEYYFEETTGNPGGTSSGWQDGPSYTDAGLQVGVQYCYRVKARDKSTNQNETDWTSTECATVPTSTASVFRVEATGAVRTDGGFYGSEFSTGFADVAEWVVVSDEVEPGDVLEFDSGSAQTCRRSATTCSGLVAGVVSTQPGITLGASVVGLQQALLALSGIVPVKVTDEGGPIQPGDLLVSSSTSGYAMRWAGPDPCPCALVGKALEPMTDECGVISVLLTSH
jgi:hypothetical protein